MLGSVNSRIKSEWRHSSERWSSYQAEISWMTSHKLWLYSIHCKWYCIQCYKSNVDCFRALKMPVVCFCAPVKNRLPLDIDTKVNEPTIFVEFSIEIWTYLIFYSEMLHCDFLGFFFVCVFALKVWASASFIEIFECMSDAVFETRWCFWNCNWLENSSEINDLSDYYPDGSEWWIHCESSDRAYICPV